MWRSIHEFEIRDLGFNTVLLLFSNEADALKIMAQQPWSFNKYLIVLYKATNSAFVEDAKFDYASFWIQIHNLLLSRMNKTNADANGRSLGQVEQIDTSPSGECRGQYIRVWVNIDTPTYISRPICGRWRFQTTVDFP